MKPTVHNILWVLALIISIFKVHSQTNPPYYDGKACASNSDCISNSCVANICGKKLKITAISKSDDQTLIQTSYSETFGSPGIFGVVVNEYDINMKGKIRTIYKFPSGDSTLLHKFTYLNFRQDITTKAKGVGICFYQALKQTFEDNTVRCAIIGTSDVTAGSNVISTPSQSGVRTNLALGKVATQSSNYNNGGVASKAVDGNTFAEYNYQDQVLNSVTHTESEFNPWWRVDLGDRRIVRQIEIYKRLDGYNGRLFDFSVSGFKNNDSVVYNESWQTTPPQCSGTIVTSCSTDDIIYIVIPSTIAPIRHIKITLNGAVERVLCLAEVVVYGISYDFQIPIGKLSNSPPTNVDRIVFFQDNAVGSAANTIKSITLQEGPDEPVFTAEFLPTSGASDLNIQGVRTITRSNNGAYIAVKDINNAKRILVYVNANILDFIDPFAANSIALSDNGLMLVSFESSSQGFVRLLRIESRNIANKDEKIGVAKFGSGVSITPDGSRAAVGSPRAAKVYIYGINPDTAEFKSNLEVIEIPSSLSSIYSGSDFGAKIALSETGNTIAIAAPKYEENGIEIGAVFLYTKSESGWIFQNIVKGTVSNQQYGVSGLAINDSSGRLDVTDFQGDISNLKFNVNCNSMYASSVGKNNNFFVPECRCKPGYKTYEGGRVIINPKDVCLPCANPNAPECNDDIAGPPGTQLTSSPTISHAPTSWSENPSLAPTINKSPSASPSSSPSFSFGSQYDGDACRFDEECFIGSCNNGVQCDSVPPVSNQCYKCESAPFQLRANDADVTAIVESTGSSIGGIIVSRTQPKQMDIYKSAQKRMKLSTRVLTSAGTRVYVNFDPTDSPSTGLRICFFESAGLVNFDEDQVRCIKLTATQDAVFSLDPAFNGKTTYIQYLGISQDSGHTKIKEIRFASEGGLKNPDGTCVDTNAFLENNECYCGEGFVTVNGDPEKQLKIVGGVVDVCVSCLETPSCKFDGDACIDDGSCYRDVRDSPCDSLSQKCNAQDLRISSNSVSDVTASLVEGNYSNSTGGVMSYESEISIFGDAYKVFRTNRMISVSRFTQVTFTALRGPSSTGLLQICFFLENETSFSEDSMSISYFEKRCFEVGQLSTLAKSFVIKIGEELFNSRTVDDLNYIGFKQTESLDSRAVTATIKDLRIDLSDSIDFIDSNGRCVDENRDSDLPFSLSPRACKCKDGYVNSNGGKLITANDDKCVPCLEPCGFDGDNCTYTTDCFSGVCGPTNTCEAPSLILKYKGNEYKDIDLDPLLGSSTRGTGIFVTHNGQIELEANVFKFYKVTGDPIEINKFTKIRFDSNKRPSTDVLKLCMYDSSSDFECVKYCHSISDPGFQTHDIFASELFASRKVNITHIAFEQACSNCVQYERSFISNLQILEGTVTDSYKDGKCTDVNAVVVASNNELVCKCSDGYISSSGRKLLDNEDSCVKCVGGLACNAGKIADDVICFNDLNIYLRLGGLQADPTVANARYSEDFLTGLSLSGGGVEIYSLNSLTSNSLSLVGKMAKIFSLQVPYTVETFSRLLLDFVPHDADGDQLFVSICFQQLPSSTRDSSAMCYALEWTYLPQMSWNYVTNPLLKLNVALGKTAIQSTTDGLNIASNAVDGSSTFDTENEASNKVTSTQPENFPFWEVDLAGEYIIDQVVIYFIPDPDVDVLKDYNILFIDRKNQISFNYYGDATLESSIQIINVPLNVIASKVRIVLNMMDGNPRILSLVEVEIFQRLSKSTKKIDIPLGKLNNGFVVDRIAFVQSGNNVNMVSNLSNITFVYGSAPEITEAPTISPAPSMSFQPSITSSPTVLNGTAAPIPTTITESPSSSATFGST